MRKTLFSLSFAFLLTTATSLLGGIVESKQMSDLYKYLEPETLVVLDIDNTLIEPVQELGSDQWFGSRIKHYQDQNLSGEAAKNKALREWQTVQYLTDVKLVEKGIDDILSDLQRKQIPMIGLTTRGMEMCVRAVDQLESVNIDLEKTSPTKEQLYFVNERGVLFHKGILFTDNTHKGEALRKWLARIGYRPKKVLFVNDKLSHLKPVEEVCLEEGIGFVGLRYGYLDEKVSNVRHHIAEFQWNNLGRIPSDEATEKFILERGSH